MNPILDQLLVAAFILAAVAFFIFKKKKGCDACDCAAKKPKKP